MFRAGSSSWLRSTTTPARSLAIASTMLLVAGACSSQDKPPARDSSGSSGGSESSGGSSSGAAPGGTSGGTDINIVIPDGGQSDPPCEGLQCKQTTCKAGPCEAAECAAGALTTVTGIVHDPSGTLPLYNVMVYVPNGELEPLVEGASCSTCAVTVSGHPVVSAITDEAGRFVLEDVPVGADIPLVIQIGKWRRRVTLPSVSPCVENVVSDASLTRLPANRGEGDMPRIAVSTGAQDALECLLRKIGISAEEFTDADGGGRVNLFAGQQGTNGYDGGAAFPTSQAALWDSLESLRGFDVVLLSCEGGEFANQKPPAARQALFDYVNSGGRVFLSHWHKSWLERGPELFPEVVAFNNRDDDQDITATIDTSFPKGQALAEWLVNVQGSTTLGQVDLLDAQNTAATENMAYATRWIYDPLDQFTGEPSIKYVSANAPIGAPAAEQCGRVVYSDIHVSSGDTSSPNTPFPTGCTSQGLSPQEKVLIFMLFDLSACLIPDDEVPQPPMIPK
jgi:hypothetical protein